MKGPRKLLDGWQIWFAFDWLEWTPQWFRRLLLPVFGKERIPSHYNWQNFRFIHIEYENDPSLNAWDVTFIILGIGFNLRYQGHSELMDDMEETVALWMAQDHSQDPGIKVHAADGKDWTVGMAPEVASIMTPDMLQQFLAHIATHPPETGPETLANDKENTNGNTR